MIDKTSERTPTPRARLSRRRLLCGGAALLATAGGGTAWALDRFVIEHAEVQGASTRWTSDEEAPSATALSGSGTTIDISTRTSGDGSSMVTWYVADIRLGTAADLRTAFARDTFGENIIETPSAIAAANNAVFAINGDYYGFRDTGIVVRNGIVFRDRGVRRGLALDRDGTLFCFDETAQTAASLVDDGVWQAWSFGPGIVEDAAVVPGIDSIEVDTNVGNHSIQGNQPRTGLGMIAANHLVAIVVDGRSPGYSRGVTMTGFAQLFADLGARVAYNLDGGGSSTMVSNGSLVNNPLGRRQERGTSDIILVAG